MGRLRVNSNAFSIIVEPFPPPSQRSRMLLNPAPGKLPERRWGPGSGSGTNHDLERWG